MLSFYKLHGLGNDYVYLDAITTPSLERTLNLPKLARQVSNRHTGIGSDGLILLCKPTPDSHAHARMRMFNADGSESPMCGNGVRCVAKLAHDHLAITPNPILIQTGAGTLSIHYKTTNGKLTSATVNMGPPTLTLKDIPVNARKTTPTDHPYTSTLTIDAFTFPATFVGMGNPHAVIFVEPTKANLADIDNLLHTLGPRIENHPAFPQRVNAHFVFALARNHAAMHTWERGSGPTQACGSGACAVLVAGVLTDHLGRAARIDLPGGRLAIKWDQRSNNVLMTGPAVESFRGTLPINPSPQGKGRGGVRSSK
jgi:diaminopimelate epimerase